MASFTDEVVNFTPYIPVNPAEAMLQVGLTKQQQYVDGLQKVQTYVDTLGGLDISKQEIKDYVQGKLNTLHQNLNNVSGDFSDQRLVSQIGGAAGKIANDPIVQNGIVATQSIRSGYQQMETARKEGKSNPNNELYFTDAVANWQNDGRVDSKFSGQYTPYFDIVKKVREVFKDMNPGQDLPPGFTLNGLKRDQNGRPIFDIYDSKEMVLMEGISVDRVQRAIDLVMQDGNAQQQINIDGYAKYRGIEPPQMFDAIVTSTQRQLDVWNSAIAAAQSKLGGSTAGDKQQLINDIQRLKQLSDGLTKQSEAMIQGLGTNPDGVKAQLVQQELNTDLVGAFAYQKMVESPLWNQMVELERLNLEKDKFVFDQLKAQNEATKKAEEDKAKQPNNYVANLPTPNTSGDLGQATMYTLKDTKLQEARSASYEALYDYSRRTGQTPPVIRHPKTNEWVWNAEDYGGGAEGTRKASEAYNQITQDMASRRTKGTLPDWIMPSVQKRDQAWTDYTLVDKRIKDIETDVKPLQDAVRKTIGTKADGSPYSSDWLDAFSVERKLPGADQAAKRLEERHGKDWRLKIGVQENKLNPRVGDIVLQETPQWKEFKSKASKNPEVVALAQQVEDKFKASQFAFQNKATVFDRSKPELKQSVKTAFSAALSEQSLARPQSDAGDMQEWMNDEDKKQANDQYFAWSETGPQGQKTWWVGIQRGSDFKKVEVTEGAFRQNSKLQEAIPNTEFQETYSSRLALRGGEDTYVDENDFKINGGQGSAFPIYMKSGTITYQDKDEQGNPVIREGIPVVQYHLEQPQGARGRYVIKLFITDGKTGKVLVQGAPYPPSDMSVPGETPALTQEQVIQMTKVALSNPAVIQGYLEKYLNK